MSSPGLPVTRNAGGPASDLAAASRWMPLLAVVAAVDIASAYVAFDRGAVAVVLGAVLAIEVLALCVFRPRPAMLAFAGFWGVAHVLLSGGEMEGGGSASVSQL